MALRDVSFRPKTRITERLVLRGYEPSDAEAVFAYASDEETTRYMAWDRHQSLADTRTFLDGYVASAYRARAAEYALCLREAPERVIGGVGLRVTSERHKTAELGYVLHRAHWGEGLIVEAARAVLAEGFEAGHIERVFAPIMRENMQSRRVAEKLGFTLEGVLRSAWWLRGRRWDEARYALLRDDWHASAGAPVGTPSWLGWARQIAAIAQTGLAFTEGGFDRERYEALAELAKEIMERAVAGAAYPPGPEVQKLLLAGAVGYATPKLDVRAAVFRDEGGEPAVLMVREHADGGWTLPGGWVDVGCSPAEAAAKEVREETGLEVVARKIVGVFDRDRQGHPPHAFHSWKVFVQCECVGGALRAEGDGLEIAEAGFFRREALAALSLSLPRITQPQLARCFEHLADPARPTDFD